LSHEESRSGKCPFCGAALRIVAAAQPAAPNPEPVDERGGASGSRTTSAFVWAVIVLLALALGGGGLYYLLSTGITFLLGRTHEPTSAAPAEPQGNAGPAASAETAKPE
jgi:hypothetical protein